MNSSNLYAIQSCGDADALIVNSATEAAKLKSTVVVGKDTDLLMLLIHGVQLSDHSVFFTSDEKSKTARKLWDVKYAKEVLGEEICNSILPIHALLGWDTTSRLFTRMWHNIKAVYSDETQHQGCLLGWDTTSRQFTRMWHNIKAVYSDVTQHQGSFQLGNKLHCRSFEIQYPFLIIPLQNNDLWWKGWYNTW